jgi:hypothetical protein
VRSLARELKKISQSYTGDSNYTRGNPAEMKDSSVWNQERWQEAEVLLRQEMETRKRVLGEEHPHTLTSMANLASAYVVGAEEDCT